MAWFDTPTYDFGGGGWGDGGGDYGQFYDDWGNGANLSTSLPDAGPFYDDWGNGANLSTSLPDSSGGWGNFFSGAGNFLGGAGDWLSKNPGLAMMLGGGLLGSGLIPGLGPKQSGTSTQTVTPWTPMQPHMAALANDAGLLYGQNRGTPQWAQDITALANQRLGGSQGLADMGMGIAGAAAQGAFDPMLNYVPGADVRGGFADLGMLDPSAAYYQMLSGQPSPWLDAQAEAIGNQMDRQLTGQLGQIRGGAIMTGNMGGSRQGIAEGQAIGDTNQAYGNALTNLYGGAFNNAQNLMAGAAGQLGQMGYGAQQFNSGLGMQQNQQGMQAAQQALGARQTGMGIGQQGYGLGFGSLGDAYNMNNQTQQYPWQNINNYGNLVSRFGGMGSQQTTPNYTNPAAGFLGGAMMAGNMYNGWNRG